MCEIDIEGIRKWIVEKMSYYRETQRLFEEKGRDSDARYCEGYTDALFDIGRMLAREEYESGYTE